MYKIQWNKNTITIVILIFINLAILAYYLTTREKYNYPKPKKNVINEIYMYSEKSLEGKIERALGFNARKLEYNKKEMKFITPIWIVKNPGDQFIWIRYRTNEIHGYIRTGSKPFVEKSIKYLESLNLEWLKTIYISPYTYGKYRGEWKSINPVTFKYTKSKHGFKGSYTDHYIWKPDVGYVKI